LVGFATPLLAARNDIRPDTICPDTFSIAEKRAFCNKQNLAFLLCFRDAPKKNNKKALPEQG